MVKSMRPPALGARHGRWGWVLLSLLLMAGFLVYYYVDRYVRFTPGIDQQAATRLEEMVRQTPADANLRLNLATTYVSQRRYDDAVRQYQAALKIEDENPVAYLGLGNTYYALGKYPQAQEAYRKLIAFYEDKPYRHSLQPLNAVYFNLALMYEKDGKLEDAAASLEEALAIDRVDADALYRLGTVRLRQGRLEEATKACEEAVRYAPDFKEAYETLVDAYGQLGRQDLQQYARGMLRYSQTDYQGAAGILEQAAPALRDHEAAWAGLAMAFEKSGRREQALAAFEEAQRVNPDSLVVKWGIQRLSQP